MYLSNIYCESELVFNSLKDEWSLTEAELNEYPHNLIYDTFSTLVISVMSPSILLDSLLCYNFQKY